MKKYWIYDKNLELVGYCDSAIHTISETMIDYYIGCGYIVSAIELF